MAANLIASLLLNKWVVIVGAIMLIYLTGGFDVVLKNPTLLLFGIMVLIIVLSSGGKRR